MERFDFVNRENADYIDQVYERYQRDPRSVDETWRAYFAGFEFAASRALPNRKAIAARPSDASAVTGTGSGAGSSSGMLTIGVHQLVHS